MDRPLAGFAEGVTRQRVTFAWWGGVGGGLGWDLAIDAQGLRCPLPVLRLRQRLAVLRAGQVVRLVADDPMAQIDVPHVCAEGGHRLIGQVVEGRATVFFVAKG